MRRAFAASERLAQLPGVQSTALTSLLPYNSSITTARIAAAGAAADAKTNASSGTVAIHSSITHGYFDSVGIRLLRGRDFTEAESRTPGSNRVCIIDARMTEKLFPGEDALGRRVRAVEGRVNDPADEMEVVGIVSRHAHGMEDRTKPAPNIYVPLAQEFTPVVFLTVRSAQ